MACQAMEDYDFDLQTAREQARSEMSITPHRFEDCGHYILEDAGEEMLGIIRGFMERDRA